ncbi:hypothetical protein [Ideonella sp. A 288]|uniref:hypothetical protein n=1 Tax=Ideonella sp. A 288 TaxID=1962181 RepID=UPI001186BAB3|nr:hypothetical protein [Ideonella sp. A 288]
MSAILQRGARAVAASLCLSTLLVACGGSGEPTAPNALNSPNVLTAGSRATRLAVAPPAPAVGTVTAGNLSGISVAAMVQTAQRRISRTVFEYDYRLTLHNTGAPRIGVRVDLVGAGAGTTIVQPRVDAGTLPGGNTTPADTITLRHDRALPFLPAQLAWAVNAPGVVAGTAAVGAALANANVSVTDVSGAAVCAEPRVVTNGTGGFTCTVQAGRVAPFVVVVTEPFGAFPPMVSIVASTPAPGTALITNATPLTTAIVAQLAPQGNALAVVANPALVDLAALARTTANVLAQLGPVLTALGVPAGYDPFSTPIQAATPTQAGNTADQVIEMLRFTTVNGVSMVSTVDNPAGGVPVAGPNTANPPVLPAPVPDAVALADAMRQITQSMNDCFALPVAQRVLAVDLTIPASAGGAEVTGMAPACRAFAHVTYVHNGFRVGQRLFGLLHDARMVGAAFSLPELMRFTDDTTPANRDQAVLNLRYVDANGVTGNLIEVAEKLPGTATVAHPTDWWLRGNQQPVDTVVRAYVRRSDQRVPTPGVAPFGGVGPSRFESGIEIFVNKDGPGSTGLRAARIKGPGLPAAGVVLTRPNPAFITDQNWLNILRKDGITDPAQTPFASSANIFKLHRTRGVAGADASLTAANPFAGSNNNTDFPDWAHPLDYGALVGTPTEGYIDLAALKAHSAYTLEIFYDGEAAPRHVLPKTILTPVVAATFARNLEWIAFDAATLRYLDPADARAAVQSTMDLAWTANPFAETVGSAGVYTFAPGLSILDAVVPVVRGATTGTAVAPAGFQFPALTGNGTSGRTLQLRYRMLDGSYKDSVSRFN